MYSNRAVQDGMILQHSTYRVWTGTYRVRTTSHDSRCLDFPKPAWQRPRTEGRTTWIGIVHFLSRPACWMLPCWLGEIQAVSTHRPNSSSWVGVRALIVKVMVGGGRQGILAPAELGPGPGEMNACVNCGVGSGRAAKMQRDEGWNQCWEQRVTCNRVALRTEISDVERGS